MTTFGAPVADRTDVHVTGRRVVSTLIDGLILGGAYALLAAGSGDVHEVGPWNWVADTSPVASVLYALVAAAYYVVMEGRFGQTLGKMVTGIRVVDESAGGVPGYGPAAIRTVLRLVDGLFGYLVAFIAVLSTQRRQRLGDMAAHTLVVRN
jgi:uncharacterized RDD family membrane protein YckC